MNDMTVDEAQAAAAKAAEWLRTPEGKKATKESIARVTEITERLNEARRYSGNEL